MIIIIYHAYNIRSFLYTYGYNMMANEPFKHNGIMCITYETIYLHITISWQCENHDLPQGMIST